MSRLLNVSASQNYKNAICMYKIRIRIAEAKRRVKKIKKFLENSIIGGVSKGHIPHSFFFV